MAAVSPLEEFPLIPLEEVAELKGGYAFKSTDYTDKGAFVLRTLNIGADGSIGRENAVFIDENRVPEFERFNLVEWDTVFVMVGATLGKTGLVRPGDLPALLNQNMWVIRAKRSLMYPRFLHYMFASQSKTLLGWASGAARDFVRRDDFRKLMMPSPPLAEQRAIADVLGAIDDKIESNRRVIKVTEELGRNELGLALRGDDGTLWEYAWPESTLEGVLDVIESGGRPKGGVAGIEEGVPSIGAESIVRAGIFNYSKTKYVPELFF